MAEIIIIVAQSKNRVIGRENQMPWHLPCDLAYFKEQTSGFSVIMGRKTFLSIGRILPNRRNIILSQEKNLSITGAEIFSNLQQALIATKHEEKVFIIGGGQVYAQALPLADVVLSTQVDVEIEDGEVFFPLLTTDQWHLVKKNFVPKDEKNLFDLTFCRYERNR